MHNLPLEFQLTIKPIGFLRSSMRVKFDAPHQPRKLQQQVNQVDLIAGLGYERALRDINGFSHIWLLWCFHRNSTWRPLVLPPRGPAKRRGVFATRSPHRPNAVGMSAVKLISAAGLTLEIGECDLVDGTPIFDIKPYLAEVDSIPDATNGWISEIETWLGTRNFNLNYSALANEQRQWLVDEWGIDFCATACEILERDPTPHRTRRIRSVAQNLFRISCGAWRLYFTREGEDVTAQRIEPGYPLRLLQDDEYDDVPDRSAQIEFLKKWP